MRLLLATILSAFFAVAHAQIDLQWNWGSTTTGKDGITQWGKSYTDSNGNMYITGTFQSSEFKLGSLTAAHPDWALEPFQICAGGCPVTYKSDAFVAKLDKDGNPLWLQTIQGTDSESGLAVTANELGEVWVLASTAGDTVYIDSEQKIFEKEQSYYSASFIAKLNADGTPNFIKQIEGADGNVYSGWIKHVNDELQLIASFGTGSDNDIDIYGQNISSSFSYNTYLLLKINPTNGTFIAAKELGSPVGVATGTNSITDVQYANDKLYLYGSTGLTAITYDSKTAYFTGGSYTNRYYVVLTEDGVAEQVVNMKTQNAGAMAIDAAHVAFVEETQFYPDYDQFFVVKYYNHQGELVNTIAQDNPSNQRLDIAIKGGVSFDGRGRLLIGAVLNGTTTLAGQMYPIEMSVYEIDKGHVLQNYYGDLMLMVVDYEEGLSHIQHIDGDYLAENMLALTPYNGKIRVVASLQSPSIDIDEHNFINNNNIGFHDFHGEPIGVFRYDNILIAEVDVIGDVNNVEDKRRPQMTIYPNPVQNTLNIQSDVTLGKSIILDALGRETKSVQGNMIDIQDLDKGTYFIQTQLGEAVVTKKFVKVN